MPQGKRIEQEKVEKRSLGAALAQGAAGGAAFAVTQQALAKLGSVKKPKAPKK